MSRKPTEVRGEAGVYIGGGEDQSQQGDAGAEQELGAASWSLVTPRPGYQAFCITSRLRFIYVIEVFYFSHLVALMTKE